VCPTNHCVCKPVLFVTGRPDLCSELDADCVMTANRALTAHLSQSLQALVIIKCVVKAHYASFY
jgi:hypothetical protein